MNYLNVIGFAIGLGIIFGLVANIQYHVPLLESFLLSASLPAIAGIFIGMSKVNEMEQKV